MQSTPTEPVTLRYVLILFLHLRLGLANNPFCFLTLKFSVCLSYIPSLLHA